MDVKQVVQEVIGPLLIGSWVNGLLYAFELSQAWLYFKKSRHDPVLLRSVVAIAVIADTICTCMTDSAVYELAINGWGDVASLLRQGWQMPVYVAMTGVSGTILETFLIWRYWRLTRQYWIVIPVLATIAFSTVYCVYTAVGIGTLNLITQRDEALQRAIIWLSAKAGTDSVIAFALIYKLARFIQDEHTFAHTRTKVYRLMLNAAESGFVPTSAGFAGLASNIIRPNTNIAVGIAFCIGRLYTLTLLLNLNSRSSTSSSTANVTGPRSSGDAETGLSGSKIIGLRSFVTDSPQSRHGRKENGSGTMKVTSPSEAGVACESDERMRPKYERQTVLDLGEGRGTVTVSLPIIVQSPDEKYL